MRLFAQEIGVRYEYVESDFATDHTGSDRTETGQETRAARPRLRQAPVKGDVIASGFTVLPWREELVAFSSPTFPTQIWLMTMPESKLAPIALESVETDIQKVKSMLKDRNILVKSGTCLEPSLYKLAETGAKMKDFPGNLNELFPAVMQGEAEATILDVPDALVAMSKWAGKIKVIGPSSEEQTMAEAFRKEDRQLRAAYEAFLSQGETGRHLSRADPEVLSGCGLLLCRILRGLRRAENQIGATEMNSIGDPGPPFRTNLRAGGTSFSGCRASCSSATSFTCLQPTTTSVGRLNSVNRSRFVCRNRAAGESGPLLPLRAAARYPQARVSVRSSASVLHQQGPGDDHAVRAAGQHGRHRAPVPRNPEGGSGR